MSENNLSDIISSLASNKEFADMVERVKESGDLSNILGEVSSLFGAGGDVPSDNVSNNDTATSEGETSDGAPKETVQEKNNTQNEGARAEGAHTEGEAKEAGLLLGGNGGGKGDGLDMGSLLGGLLPMFSKSICENSALLIALKPYLSKRRCELIDSIIKISKLASIVSLAK